MMQFAIHKKLNAANEIMHLDISHVIKEGEFVSINGASGAGKTSLLRIIAGFLNPDKGKIIFKNEVWFDAEKKINIAPQKRKVGFVFQDYALFPNMTVKENLLFALRKGEEQKIVFELMEIMEIENLTNRNVQTLSGGQKQRVALARALVRKPELLLLDEPLSAIDVALRLKLQDIISTIHHQYHLTTIIVSHDISEIIRLSDKTISLENGAIKKYGDPAALFSFNNEKQLQLKGEIIAIIKEDELNFMLQILVVNQVLKIKKSLREMEGFAKGDSVIISFCETNTSIEKLK
jgi:molybdate transport system ATP-binding protein